MDQYLPDLKDKRVGIVANQTSMVGKEHLVDRLLKEGVNIRLVFAPEHGFRGTADAGEKVASQKDAKTGIRIVSLYGKNKKPKAEDMDSLDVILFDIQDVGVRFYTYISTMHYVMQSCAEKGKKFIVLDRPNPNGHYVDGPVLDPKLQSFVGMHPVPIVHGMTICEYAQMINGEGWLGDSLKADLKVIKMKNYNHKKFYRLPIPPSPNLRTMSSIYLYPSICLFESTEISVGRGTDKPFQIIGHPKFSKGTYEFTPTPSFGSKKPKLEGELCKGYDLTNYGYQFARSQKKVTLHWLLELYHETKLGKNFFKKTGFFNKLLGVYGIQQEIMAGKTEAEIRAKWTTGLEKFKLKRKKYLLYEDFE
ncbi:MAG: DUF1343 domain-containing protein [Crocinitomicaceae bacterium]|nr:DUF1343 domain-containing protein [Crocinitomicaceae bacterium]